MSNLSLLPEKYYIIWLDQHIGEAGFCHKLKEIFFTHIAPDNATNISFTDNEIHSRIQDQSEIPINFDNFHFTFKAFVEVQPCLQYIRQIHQHRILLIASSTLGQPVVEQIIQEYPDLFMNKLTGKPYISIYIFCTDIAKAIEWGFDYLAHLLAFDHEADLLERITNELCKEFLEQAKYLVDAGQYKAAFERASWSRNVLTHYEDLENKSACRQLQQGKSSKKLCEIDQLIEQIEKQMKMHRDDISYNDIVRNEIDNEESSVCPIKHRIIYLDELRDYSLDKNQQTTTYLSNLPIQLGMYHYIDDVLESITDERVNTVISFVIIASDIGNILNKLSNINKPIDNVYILGNCLSEIIEWINYYAKMNIQIQVFPIYEKLLSNLLEDISQSYMSKGTNADLIYFDWAKELVIRTRQIQEDQINKQLNSINQQKQQRNKLTKQSNSNDDLEQQIQNYLHSEDSDHIIMIFYVQSEIQPIDFDNDLARILSCQTIEQVISLVRKIQLKNPIAIISTTSPSDEVLALCQLRFYFCLLHPNESLDNLKQNTSNIFYVFSEEHILNELYNKLGEYYRDTAIQLSMEFNDQGTPDRLLQRSTKCYKLLQNDIEKILKHYKEVLPIQ